ncbi:uncharacterized protein LOC129609559 [Condylostylus longicornis]|uniref:uncharacterized protein LOC129609559 n=1 Tax=Condylostylus longicornis TaxID=2530218 RepID=UPI00244E2795|nr:uncharacterized protein LOC129609559 [Condylostylus longicornis]
MGHGKIVIFCLSIIFVTQVCCGKVDVEPPPEDIEGPKPCTTPFCLCNCDAIMQHVQTCYQFSLYLLCTLINTYMNSLLEAFHCYIPLYLLKCVQLLMDLVVQRICG